MVIHEVKRSETSASIARQYGISVGELASANQLTDPGKIFVGQSLRIPAGADGGSDITYSGPDSALRDNAGSNRTAVNPEHFATYRVQRGDTVSSIGRQFNISPSSILAVNGIGPKGDIRSGQELVIPVDQYWATLSPPN